MAKVSIQKRGKVYKYKFEISSIDGKRKFINKSGFKTKAEAEKEGIIAYNEYINTGHKFVPNNMSYSDYLDYWIDTSCNFNRKYLTIVTYLNIIKNCLKSRFGMYHLFQFSRLIHRCYRNLSK